MVGKPPGRSIAVLLAEPLPQLRILGRLLACLICAGALLGALQVNVALHADQPAARPNDVAILTAQPPERR